MEKNMYQIQYTDNTCRMVEWSENEFQGMVQLMVDKRHIGFNSEGVYILTDVRAIVLIPKQEPDPEDEKSQLSEYGHYDRETIEWLRANGVDINGGGK